MRKTLLLTLTLLLLSLAIPQMGQARQTDDYTIFYGYCAFEEPSPKTAIGYESDPSHLGVAAYYESDFLKPFVGDQVIGIRVAVLKDVSASVFIKKNVEGTPLQQKEVHLKKGWNEVLFDTPQPITQDGSYAIGYEFDNAKEVNIIGVQSFGRAHEHGIYLSQYGGKYLKYSSGYGSNLMVQMIVRGRQREHFINKLYVNKVTTQEDVKAGESSSLTIDATNYGINSVDYIDVSYSFAGKQVDKLQLPVNLKPGETAAIEMPLKGLVKTGLLHTEITSFNGTQLPTPLTYEQMVYYYTKSYPRAILQEQFGTERSRITPYAQTDLNYALPGYEDKVVWIQHHVGFNEDKFTIPGSRDLLFFYGNPATYCPAMMLNRRVMKGPYTVPTFAVPWSERIQELYNEELERPAFAEIALDGEYNPATRKLDIKISGNIATDQIDPNNCVVSVAVIENNIYSTTQEGLEDVPGGEGYIQQHTIRSFATEALGSAPQWGEDGHFTYHGSTVLDNSWKDNEVNIIAFVHKKANKVNLSDNEVYNATKRALSALPTSLSPVISSDIILHVDRGRIVCSVPTRQIQIYDMWGRLHVNYDLDPGHYIVLVQTEDGVERIVKVTI